MTPDHTHDNDIERLMRHAFSDAEEQPPASAWEKIERSQASARRRRHLITTIIVAAVLVAATEVAMMLLQPLHDDTLPAQQPASPAATSANDATTVAIPATVAMETAPAASQTHGVTLRGNTSEPRKGATTANVLSIPTASESDAPPATTSREPQPISTITTDDGNLAEVSLPNTAAADTHSTPDTTLRHAPHARPMRPQWLIPNVITPNGDGINDCFVIQGLENYAPVQVVIYTANSRRVYISDDYRNDFCGDGMPAGNYFYVLTVREGPCAGFVRRGTLVVKDQ